MSTITLSIEDFVRCILEADTNIDLEENFELPDNHITEALRIIDSEERVIHVEGNIVYTKKQWLTSIKRETITKLESEQRRLNWTVTEEYRQDCIKRVMEQIGLDEKQAKKFITNLVNKKGYKVLNIMLGIEKPEILK